MPDESFRGWPDCDVCREPVTTPAEANLSLDARAAARTARANRARIEEASTDVGGVRILTLGDMAQVGLPRTEPWRWTHDRCTPEGQSYQIGGERLDTLGKVLSWTLHLQEKTWFDHGAWEGAIRRFWTVPSA